MSRLPSGYTELEYIESSGTQYINTGLKNSAGDSYEIELTPLVTNETQRYFGGLLSNGIGLGLRNDGNIMAFAGAWVYPSGVKPTINQKIKVEYRSGYGWYLDDTLIDDDTSTTTESQNNILVCSVEYNKQAYYPASVKLYHYKHTNEQGTTLMELVPCKNSSNVVGMYDLVSESFFGNAGTGEFIGGRPVAEQKTVYNKVASLVGSRLPSDYQEVEYLESTGTQYILVDYEINNNIKLECDFQFTELISGQNNIIGLGNGNYNRFTFGFSQTPRFLVGLGENFYLEATDYYTRKLYTLDAKNKTAKCDDEEFTFTGTFSFNALTKKDLILFARYSTVGVLDAFCKGKLYSAKYYDNDVLVRNLVPCYRKADNVAGLYDLVSGNFYINSGSGTFEVGNDIGSSAIIKHYRIASINNDTIKYYRVGTLKD